MSTHVMTYLNYMSTWEEESDENIDSLIAEHGYFVNLGDFDSDNAIDSEFKELHDEACGVRDATIAADALQISADVAACAAIWAFPLSMAFFAPLEVTAAIAKGVTSSKSAKLNAKLKSVDDDIAKKLGTKVSNYVAKYKSNNKLIASKNPAGMDTRTCRANLMQFIAEIEKQETLDAVNFRKWAKSCRLLYNRKELDDVLKAVDHFNLSKQSDADIDAYIDKIYGFKFIGQDQFKIVRQMGVYSMYGVKLGISAIKKIRIARIAKAKNIPVEEVGEEACGVMDAVGKVVTAIGVIMSVVDIGFEILDIVDVCKQCEKMCDNLDGPIKQKYKDYFDGMKKASRDYQRAIAKYTGRTEANPPQQAATCPPGRPHSGSDFRTWWHESGVVNEHSPVDPASVRQSRRYLVQVRSHTHAAWADSFAYEAIPRNGMGRVYSPWDLPGSDTQPAEVDDGVSRFEAQHNICMAWSSFLYAVPVDIRLSRRDGKSLGAPSGVTIRPTEIRYQIDAEPDGSMVIHIPYHRQGCKFSVEFDSDLLEYRSDGTDYVDRPGVGRVVGREPQHALLVFASPFPSEGAEPPMLPENTHTMSPGPINDGDWASDKQCLYFPPGVYWMNQAAANGMIPKLGELHMTLHSNTTWVHLSPGAYVKGALEFTTSAPDFRLTGHGVLSGEHYVYQANPKTFYQSVKHDGDSLRMISHYTVRPGQVWHCHGPTIANPPFNVHDFFGASDSTSVVISDYKQVGGYFFQTDGPQLYPHSTMSDVFLHANDDVIKAYHPHVDVSRVVVWKGHNGPIVQLGWKAREVSHFTIAGLRIIHTRYRRDEMKPPSAIIGASPLNDPAACAVQPHKAVWISITDLVSEGPSPGLLRITPLQSHYDVRLSGCHFPDGLQRLAGESRVPAAQGADSTEVAMHLAIENWSIGGTPVTMDNFQADRLGRFNIDETYWGQWSIRAL